MPTIRLSDAALVLLRRRLAGEWVEVTDDTRPLYRELVDAGMMIPLHSSARGNEGGEPRSIPAQQARPPGITQRRLEGRPPRLSAPSNCLTGS